MRTNVPARPASSFARLIAGFSSSATERGAQFEALCKWILESPAFPEIVRVSRPLDIGIDWIAETEDGGRWAIQCKCLASDSRISKPEIDSFLSASATGTFERRLLMATTEHIGRNARRVLGDQATPVTFYGPQRLSGLALDWPISLDELEPAQRTALEARPHQHDAITATVTTLSACDRTRVVMACGTGKTLVALRVAEQLESELTLVVAPNLALLSGLIDAWTANAKYSFARLAVCSDSTVDEPDSFSSRDLSAPVTTDVAAIRKFLFTEGPRVVFTTYQSAVTVGAALNSAQLAADLLVADEAHRSTGLRASVRAAVLDNARVPARRRLFLTATPRYIADIPVDVRRASIASMDNEDLYGPLAYELTFAQAIERGLLANYEVFISVISDREVANLVDQRELVAIAPDHCADAETLGKQVLTLRIMRERGLRSVLAFFNRVPRAAHFADELPRVNDWAFDDASVRVRGATVSAAMPTGVRAALLTKLAAATVHEPFVVTSVGCLSEGVDVPAIDGIVIAEPRNASSDISQLVGRGLRRDPANPAKIATIVVPIFIPEGMDATTALLDERFAGVWRVLRALSHHDAKLARQFDALRLRLSQHHSPGAIALPANVVLDVPLYVERGFATAVKTQMVKELGRTPQTQMREGLIERMPLPRTRPAQGVTFHGNSALTASLLEGLRLGIHRSPEFRSCNPQSPELRALRTWLAEIELHAWGSPANYFEYDDAFAFRRYLRYGDLPLGHFPLLERELSPFTSSRDLDSAANGARGLEQDLRRTPAITPSEIDVICNHSVEYDGLVTPLRGLVPDEAFARSAALLFDRYHREHKQLSKSLQYPFEKGFDTVCDSGDAPPPTDNGLFDAYARARDRFAAIDAHIAGYKLWTDWAAAEREKRPVPPGAIARAGLYGGRLQQTPSDYLENLSRIINEKAERTDDNRASQSAAERRPRARRRRRVENDVRSSKRLRT